MAEWPFPVIVTEGIDEKRDLFAASDAALAASGTVTYELACAGVPMVIAYRMSGPSFQVIRMMIKIKYASVVNIVLGHEVAPEFIQGDCTPEKLETAVGDLLGDDAARAAQRRDLAEVAQAFGLGGPPSSRRAADVIMGLLAGRRDGPSGAGSGSNL